MFRSLFVIKLLLFSCLASALSVVDDSGAKVELDNPAKRVITLAPSLTEMMFEIKAQDKLVATVEFSNYPKAANDVPRVGNYEKFNMERLLSFKPDLVIGWSSANTTKQLVQLEKLNIPVYRSEPHEFSDIARTLRNLGILTGNAQTANQAAHRFESKLSQLVSSNKHKQKLNVFYQVWHQPIYTINGKHVISKVMQICNLNNVFAKAQILAPKVTRESVINKNPDMIISGGMAEARPEWLESWKSWKSVTAVKLDNLFWIHPDLIHRQSPRILQGAEIMCQQADKARERLTIRERRKKK